MIEQTLINDANKIEALVDIDMKDFIIDGIHKALDDPNTITNGINYINIFDSIVKKVIDENYDNPELVNDIKNEKEKVYSDIKSAIEEKLEISIDLEPFLPSEQYDVIHIMYSYFINDYHSNMVEFLTNYIIKNKKSIFNSLIENKSKKEVTDALAKKLYKNSKDAVIMSNTYKILKCVLQGDIEPMEFLKYLFKNISPTNKVVSDMILKHIDQPITFNANFYEIYTSFALNDDRVLIDLMTSLQMKLYNIFPKNESNPILFN